MRRFKGMIVAPFTGFKENGEVDLDIVKVQQQYYKDNGIAGVFVCGTTGEGSALTMSEKKTLFKEWSKYKTEDFAIIGFLGGTSYIECQDLACYAQDCNLDAVALTAPYYQKAANVADLSAYCAKIASVVPEMPFFYYHIPCLTNVNFAMYDLLQAMDKEIPNLAGIKYTYENLMDYQLCLNFKNKKYDIMWGRDEMLLPALSVGAQAYVGSTYGYNAPVYHEVERLFHDGKISEAADAQLIANNLITLLGKYGNGAGKAFMKAADMDLGPCRLPLHTLPEETYKAFLEDAKAMDFDAWKCVRK